MKTLVDDGEKRYFRHRVSESCVVSSASESGSLVVILNEDDLKSDAVRVKQEFLGVIKSQAPQSFKVAGCESWVLKVCRWLTESGQKHTVNQKQISNDDWVLIDIRSGSLKVQSGSAKSLGTLSSKSTSSKRLGVMIIDDSATMRKILRGMVESEPDMEVVAESETAESALESFQTKKPDVISLDINLPGMDGVQFLAAMSEKAISIPTVVVTSLNLNDGDKVFEALQKGAIDYIQKPDLSELDKSKEIICSKFRAAASANVSVTTSAPASSSIESVNFKELQDDTLVPVFLGSSTGGTTAIERMLSLMSPPIPPIVIVQHIPPLFSKAFAERINAALPFEIKEAEEGDRLVSNSVYIAPGGTQMGIHPMRVGGDVTLSIRDLPPVNRFKPSVDFLFESVAINYRGPHLGVILTGMGRDGAEGMKSMKENNDVITIAQDEASSVVFGMPKAAIHLGCVDYVCHLDEIPKKLKESLLQLRNSERKTA